MTPGSPVGSEVTPPTVLAGMEDMARELGAAGWYLRTGGAKGLADEAFARDAAARSPGCAKSP